MTSSYLPSLGGNEVGCIEVHQERSLICVAEKGVMPNVFIYEYPSLSLMRVLKGGTERAYSAAHFSGDGEKLATVGAFPDYMLTVWDWNKEAIVLRTKAFAQEVYRVRFSPRFEGQLVTSGTGHIRFWRMAETFTGLKLQGDIGKFGQVELSDVEGFCELPDGKVRRVVPRAPLPLPPFLALHAVPPMALRHAAAASPPTSLSASRVTLAVAACALVCAAGALRL